ncbi:MAG: hypothetical protein ACI8QD_001089 [Cyclobacteriaceae bacterium]|jgi:hypothetical protein
MIKYLLTFVLSTFSLLSLAQVTWDGGAGTDNWSDANNWNPNGLPDDGDDVVISNGDLVIVDFNTNANLDDLTISGGSTLRIETNGFVDLDGNGVLTITGASTLEISGGELDSDDDIIINGGSTVTVSSGTLDISQGGSGATIDNATINLTGGLIDFGANINLTDTDLNVSGGELNIDGGDLNANNTNITVTGGLLDLNDDLNLTNGATLNISAGLVDVTDVSTANNSAITLSGGEFESGGPDDDLDLENGATLTMTGGILDVEDLNPTDNSSVLLSGGTVEINDIITSGTATLIVDGANVTVDTIDATGDSEIELLSGVITSTGDLTVTDTANVTITTTFTNTNVNDDLEVFGGGTLNIGDPAVITGFNDLQFDADPATATVNITGGSLSVSDDINADNSSGDIVNISGGTLNAANDLDILDSDITINLTGGTIDVTNVDDNSEGTNGVSNNITVTGDGSVVEGGVEVLPVELIDFDGSYDGLFVRLTWSTAAELNNHYFEVQQSMDGERFIPIGIVEGNGTTSEQQIYTFEDRTPQNGIIYYRLRQVDFEGEEELLPTISVVVNQEVASSVMSLYPNPIVSDHVSVALSGEILLNGFQVQLISLSGKNILTEYFEAGTANITLPISASVQPGHYIIRTVGPSHTLTLSVIVK